LPVATGLVLPSRTEESSGALRAFVEMARVGAE
jgi:hypothetical protein